MTKPGRIPCCVPFCRRTSKADGGATEVICAKHYRVTNKTLRRRYRKHQRRYSALVEGVTAQLPPDLHDEAVRLSDMLESEWSELKRQSIDAAMGI